MMTFDLGVLVKRAIAYLAARQKYRPLVGPQTINAPVTFGGGQGRMPGEKSLGLTTVRQFLIDLGSGR